MRYVSLNNYTREMERRLNRPLRTFSIEKLGYSVLHDINSNSGLISDYCPTGFVPVKFVVVFRTIYTNLVVVWNNSFALSVEVPEEQIPVGATFDDIILLHGKKFIENTVVTNDISNFIMSTSIQPWGVVCMKDALYIPIEILVEDNSLKNKVFSLNSNIVNMDKNITDIDDDELLNGFVPISKVKKVLGSTFSNLPNMIDACIISKLMEVHKSE